MTSDKLSVGPPQLGDIDIFRARDSSERFVDRFKSETSDNPSEKSLHKDSFQKVLDKKTNLKDKSDEKQDNAVRDSNERMASGGTKRKMPIRKVDDDPVKASEEDELSTQPALNTMASNENRIKVVDDDKNPFATSVHSAPSEKIQNLTSQTDSETQLQDSDQIALDSTGELVVGMKIDAGKTVDSQTTNVQSDELASVENQSDFAKMIQAKLALEQIGQGIETDEASQVLPSLESTPTEALDFRKVNTEALLSKSSLSETQQLAQSSQFLSNSRDTGAESQSNEQSNGKSSESSFDQLSKANEGNILESDSSESYAATSSLHTLPSRQEQRMSAAAPLAQAPAMSFEQQKANASEVAKQVDYLVKDGGGVARIKMSPEGLGQIDLKVTLDQGRVQIEMNTDDPHVKKLMQETVRDLQSGLASQQFSLEHVKINQVNATDASFGSQLNHPDSQGSNPRMNQQQSQNQNQWQNFEQQFTSQQQNRNFSGRFDSQHQLPKGESVERSYPENRLQQSSTLKKGYGNKTVGSSLNLVA